MTTPDENGRSLRGQRPDSPEDSNTGSVPIRILIAEDQHIDRKGLIAILESQRDFEIVGEAVSGKQAAEMCKSLTPDVLILDTRMPDLDGITAIPDVKNASPQTRILAMAERGEGRCLVLNPPRPGKTWQLDDVQGCTPNSDCLQLAVVAGAHGAIRRSATPDDLYRAIRAVAGGHAWYEAGTATRLLERARHQGTDSEALSPREMEVAGLIADGYCNKDIARALGITTPTVKKHVGRILTKLGLEDRLQVGLHLARNPLLLRRVGA